MPAVNLAFGTLNSLRKIFGSDTPSLSVTKLAGGAAVGEPASRIGNLWRYLALDSQYLFIPNGKKGELVKTPQSSLRFLPWAQDQVTGMEIDGAARVLVTGPLNGCSFFAARDPHSGAAVFLHANSNQNTGDVPGRNRVQLQYAMNYLGVFHAGAPVLFETQYERDMNGKQGWMIAVDVHGDSRTWQILLIHTEKLGSREDYLKDLGTVQIG